MPTNNPVVYIYDSTRRIWGDSVTRMAMQHRDDGDPNVSANVNTLKTMLQEATPGQLFFVHHGDVGSYWREQELMQAFLSTKGAIVIYSSNPRWVSELCFENEPHVVQYDQPVDHFADCGKEFGTVIVQWTKGDVSPETIRNHFRDRRDEIVAFLILLDCSFFLLNQNRGSAPNDVVNWEEFWAPVDRLFRNYSPDLQAPRPYDALIEHMRTRKENGTLYPNLEDVGIMPYVDGAFTAWIP